MFLLPSVHNCFHDFECAQLYLTNNIAPTSVGVNTLSTIVLLTLITKWDGGALLTTQHTHFCLILCLILRGNPKEGGNATSPLHCWGSPNKRGQNQNWLPHPCLRGGPNEGGNAMSPLHSRESPNKGGQNQKSKPTLGGNNDAPSISKYGSLVRLATHIVALR